MNETHSEDIKKAVKNLKRSKESLMWYLISLKLYIHINLTYTYMGKTKFLILYYSIHICGIAFHLFMPFLSFNEVL